MTQSVREREIEMLAERIARDAVAMGGGRPDTGLEKSIADAIKQEILKATQHPDLSLAVEALKEAELQIVYLHDKFQETGSGNQAIAKIRSTYEQITKG